MSVMVTRKKTRTKLPVTSTLRVNAYAVLERAVEEGVAYGLGRVAKYATEEQADALDKVRAAIAERVHDEVMSAVCEVFRFDVEGE